MMTQQEVLRLLMDLKVFMNNDHFAYTSGRHGSDYVNKDAIYTRPAKTSELCLEIAERFKNHNIGAVIAPAVGGVILSQWVAHHLTNLTGYEVLALYADKAIDGSFAIKRGYDKLIYGKRVLAVEDILHTGGSIGKVIKSAEEIGCEIIGLGVICNRAKIIQETIGNIPVTPLINIKFDSFDQSECPLCKEGVPINTEFGKGREFLLNKQN